MWAWAAAHSSAVAMMPVGHMQVGGCGHCPTACLPNRQTGSSQCRQGRHPLICARSTRRCRQQPAPPHPPALPAAANNTWWNIYSSEGTQLNLPECAYGPLLNFVGGPYGPPDCKRDQCDLPARHELFPGFCRDRLLWWVEQRERGKTLLPSDLFQAMVDTRRQRLGRR